MKSMLLLIYRDEAKLEQMTEADRAAEMPQWIAYTQDLATAGVLRDGAPLEWSASAKTARGTVVTDGPFAETKEALGGFYLLETDTFEEAVEWGRKCPGAQWGAIEVRGVIDMAMPDAG